MGEGMDQLWVYVAKAMDVARARRVGVNWDEPITTPERLRFCLNPFRIFCQFQQWSGTLLPLTTVLISLDSIAMVTS
jgi:hypothetical protein